jgi:ubiquinone/menaquinone biosynthesis C-methylase UbiE
VRNPLKKRPDDSSYATWWDGASADRAGAYATTYVADDETDYRSRGWNGDPNSYGARQLVEMAGLDKTSRILEVGCGAARVGREMAAHVGQWHGADISENMLVVARQRTTELGNVFFHRLSDVSLSEFADESFDFVYITTVLMHLDKEDLFQYLKETWRVLKPGRAAFFDTWNLLNPDTYRQWLAIQRDNHGMQKEKSRGRIQFTTAPELRAYLDDAGFEVVKLDEDKLLRALCRKTPLRLHLSDDGLAPFGYVDSPRNESVHQGTLPVWGWVLDDIRTIEVSFDGRVVATGAAGQPRPDVAPLFPRYPGAATCGYGFEVPLADVPKGHHTIQVVAIDGAGRRTDLAGNYQGFTVG